MIRWALGFDPREAGAFYTMAHSLQVHASMPISITPVSLTNLRGILTRARDAMQSNDFAFSRFLVPWMFGFEGWVVFSDCDMLAMDDPAKLWALRDDRYAIQCVQHDYQPTSETKYLGNQQTAYERKCWSSLMLMNCARLRMLTPAYVNQARGLELHQFRFLEDEQLGALPAHWNHLVGHDEGEPAIVHWTEGGPYFREYATTGYMADYWRMNKAMKHIQGGL